MIWLYDEFETDFSYNGISLNSAYEADIHRVSNGLYKLSFKLPTTDDELYTLVEKGMVLKASEKGRTNLFRIKYREFNDTDNSLSIIAYQIFISDFSKKLVRNFTVIDRPCTFALSAWHSAFLTPQDRLTYDSSISSNSSFSSFKDEKDTESKDSIEVLNGIVEAYGAEVDLHNFTVNLKARLGRDTEEVLVTSKNISDFVDEFNEDEIYTRIYATATFRPDVDKDEIRARHKQERDSLRASQKAFKDDLSRRKKEERMQAEIDKRYAREISKEVAKLKRSKTTKSYEQISQEVRDKYARQLAKSTIRKAESAALAERRKSEMAALKERQKEEYQSLTEEITISVTVDSPFIDDYPFVNEISISNNDCRTVDELYDWANSYFTEKNIDKPKRSIKVSYEQISEDVSLGDTVILKHERAGVDERIRVVETHYDPMGEYYTSYILGEITSSLGSEISKGIDSGIGNLKGYFDSSFGNYSLDVEQQLRNFDRVFDNKFEEAKQEHTEAQERAEAKAEEFKATIREEIERDKEEVLGRVRETTADFNRKLEESKRELSNSSGRGVNAEVREAIEGAKREASRLVTEAKREASVSIEGAKREATSAIESAKRESGNLVEGLRAEANALVEGAKSEARAIKDKVDNLKVGGRNLALRTSKDWSTPYTNFNGGANNCPNLYRINISGLSVGDVIFSRIVLRYTNITSASGQTARIWLQGYGNVTNWGAGSYNASSAKVISGSGEMIFEHSIRINEHHLRNSYWGWQFRTDYIASGSLEWKLAKVEKGTIPTDWSPAPEDYMYELEQLSNGYREKFTSLEAKARELDTFRTEINRTVSGISQGVSTINQKFDSAGELISLKQYKSSVEQKDREITTKLTALEQYKNQDGTRQTTLLSLAERKTNELLNREIGRLSDTYVAKNTLTETIRGSERKIIDSIKVSNFNLLKNANAPISETTSYWVGSYPLAEPIEDGEEVTLTIKVKFSDDRNKFLMPYNSGGIVNFDFNYRLSSEDDSTKYHILSKTFRWRSVQPGNGSTANNTKIDFYHYFSNNPKPISISWATLVRGKVGTVEWIPSKFDSEKAITDRLATYRQEVDRSISELRGIATDGQSKASRLEQTVNGVSTTVTSLTGRLDNLKYGGRNYIRNSRIEKVFDSSTGNRFYELKTYLLRNTETYTFSAKVKNIVGNNGNRLTIGIANPSNLNSNMIADVPIINGMVTHTFSPPWSSDFTSVLIYKNSRNWAGSAQGEVTYYDYKLEQGTEATPWSPAPEDEPTALTLYKTERQQTDRSIQDSISTINRKFDASGELISLKTYKTQVEQKDREIITKLTALEEYKNTDGSRRTETLTLAERKTNELLNREISRLSDTYVSKNSLTETIRGSERKILESIKVGGRNYILKSKDPKELDASTNLKYFYYTVSRDFINDINKINDKNIFFAVDVVGNNLTNPQSYSLYYGFSVDITYESGGSIRLNGFLNDSSIDRTLIKKSLLREKIKNISVSIFNNLVGVVTFSNAQLKISSVESSWSPALEDGESFVTDKIATYRREVDSTLTELRGIATDGKSLATRIEADLRGVTTSVSTLDGKLNAYKTEREQTDRSIQDSISTINRKFDASGELISLKTYKSQVEQKDREIRSKVTTLENGTLKKSEVVVTDSRVELGSGKVIDGRKLGSILSVSPEGVQAITDKMTITAYNENLVLPSYRGKRQSFTSDTTVSVEIPYPSEYEFFIKAKVINGRYNDRFRFIPKVKYEDNTVQNGLVENNTYFALSTDYSFTCKFTPSASKKVKSVYFVIDRHGTTILENLEIYQKKSASLIVDGSITADQIKAEAIESGHIKAGAITSEKIDASAIEAKHLKVDAALINKLTTDNALINNLMAKQAFINKLQTVAFDFTKATGDYIQSSNGSMKWDLRNNVFLFKKNTNLLFKDFGNALVMENKGMYNGHPTSGGLTFTNVHGTDITSVVLGTSSGSTFNANDVSFTGLRVLQKDYECGLYGSKVYISDTFDDDGNAAWNNKVVLNQEGKYITLTSRSHSELNVGADSCQLKITPTGIWVIKNGTSRQLI